MIKRSGWYHPNFISLKWLIAYINRQIENRLFHQQNAQLDFIISETEVWCCKRLHEVWCNTIPQSVSYNTIHQSLSTPYTSLFQHHTPVSFNTIHLSLSTPYTSLFQHHTPVSYNTIHQSLTTPYTSLLQHHTPCSLFQHCTCTSVSLLQQGRRQSDCTQSTHFTLITR